MAVSDRGRCWTPAYDVGGESAVARLLGKPYRWGADGTGEAIDCIHLVYQVRYHLGLWCPPFNPQWYSASTRQVLRELLGHADRVKGCTYTGDVALTPQDRWAFGVVWQDGILFINQATEKVGWCSHDQQSATPYFFRTRESYANS